MWNFTKLFSVNTEVNCTNNIYFLTMLAQIKDDIFCYFSTPTFVGYAPSTIMDDEYYQTYRNWRRDIKKSMKQLRDIFSRGITPHQLYEFLIALQKECKSPTY